MQQMHMCANESMLAAAAKKGIPSRCREQLVGLERQLPLQRALGVMMEMALGRFVGCDELFVWAWAAVGQRFWHVGLSQLLSRQSGMSLGATRE